MHPVALAARVLFWLWVVVAFLYLSAMSGCAMPEYESDNWRDAVKSGQGLIRGS